jgi:hypothetical protein
VLPQRALTVVPLALAVACGREPLSARYENEGARTSSETAAAGDLEPLLPSDLETHLPAAVREDVLKPFMRDFDEMITRRVIHVGITASRTFYFVDKGVQRGVAYEYSQLMEDRVIAKLRRKKEH